MKTLGIALLTTVLFGTAVAPALAADLIVSPDPIVETGSFTWEGPYVGGFLSSYPSGGQVAVGAELGYNFLPTDSLLLGASITGAVYLTGYAPEAFIKGRVGLVTDRFVVYGFGAAGNFSGGPGVVGAGAGVEFAVMNNLSFDAEGGLYTLLGGGGTFGRAEAGLRFHF